jgi:hypothetical protein
MPSYNETNPLRLGPADELSGDEIRTAIALGLASLLFVVLALLGLRCVVHHLESFGTYLWS